jgi:hypothetical protein
MIDQTKTNELLFLPGLSLFNIKIYNNLTETIVFLLYYATIFE